ncbi:MAG: SIMPL domain-containing protein [Candidatus Buchananbacteria bacterium]
MMEDLKNHWPKLLIVLVVILAITSIVIVALLRDRLVSNNQWTVSVNGRGRVLIKPDLAVINLGVDTFKVSTAKEALAQNSVKMNKISAKLKELGIAEMDIKTTNYNLSPVYEVFDGRSRPTGYTVNQQLTIKVRDLTKVGVIIEAVTNEGANQIGEVSFTVDNLEAVKDEARLLAIADAKAKAGKLAQTAGVRLGKTVGFWENYVSGSEADVYGKGGIGGGMAVNQASISLPPVSGGQLEVIVEMSLTYKIK